MEVTRAAQRGIWAEKRKFSFVVRCLKSERVFKQSLGKDRGGWRML